MPPSLPQRTRVYRCHHLDSTRWDGIVPRPDDIIITTSLKAGTTWTQRIVSLLVFQTCELPLSLHSYSPWPDARFVGGKAEMLAIVESLAHRRFLKSHLALDGLPYWETTKYIGSSRKSVGGIWVLERRKPVPVAAGRYLELGLKPGMISRWRSGGGG